MPFRAIRVTNGSTGVAIRYREAVAGDKDLAFVCKYCADLIPEREVDYGTSEVEHIYLQQTVIDVPDHSYTIDSVDMSYTDELQSDDVMQSTIRDVDNTTQGHITFQLSRSYALQPTEELDATRTDDSSPEIDSDDDSSPEIDSDDDSSPEIDDDDDDSGNTSTSFRIDATFGAPNVIQERSLADPQPSDTIIEYEDVEYRILKGGSIRGKDLLVDSTGYTFTVKELKGRTTYWTCSVRGRNDACTASVSQRADTFTAKQKAHNHAADPSLVAKAVITNKAKEVARDQVFQPALSKQIPMAYIFMSRRTKKDYVKVFQAIGRLLEGDVHVTGFVMDYEVAAWEAVKVVFRGATITGCSFHWSQAVWRKVQALGLATEYLRRKSTFRFIRKLLCVPFLPAEHLSDAFESLVDLSPHHHLRPLCSYIDRTWFRSTTWTPENWSVYGQSIRTNNDCEGWHNRLNTRAVGTPPFYRLVQVLHREAGVGSMQADLVSEQKLRRYQRRMYSTMQGKIMKVWDSYRAGDLSTTGLLKSVATFYGPAM